MTSSPIPPAPPDLAAPPRPQPLYIPRTALLFVALLGLLVANFELLRAGLVWRNPPGTTDARADVWWAFGFGARFDLVASAYFLAPFAAVCSLPWVRVDRSRRARRWLLWTLAPCLAVLVALALGEYEFFREFQSRYNQLAIKYLDHAGTVTGMVFETFPVFRYGAVIAAWSVILVVAVALVMRGVLGRAPRAALPPDSRGQWGLQALSLAAFWVVMAVCMRGGLQKEPIRWGDAYKSQSAYANELGLNGTYTLGRTLLDYALSSNASSAWIKSMPLAEAREVTRGLVFAPGEAVVDPEHCTVSRALRTGDDAGRWLKLRPGAPAKPNVVVVIMESFSGRYCGAEGYPEPMSPELDALAREGIFFRRTFSAGTHTHQGVFSTLLGFPNLPGYEDLMQDSMSRQPFSSIPSVLKQAGYHTLFLYNGDFSWDNMYGMFRDHGVERFVGLREFRANRPGDAVWGGVKDHEVFERANAEFEAMGKAGPFCGVILTLSNHVPFNLPDPLPFPHTTGHGDLNERLDAYRYADWSVGRFMEGARKLDYYKNTVFVFVGDHGFAISPALTDVHLLFHHVPLVFYSPLFEQAGAVRDEAAMQANIAPTLFGLLKIPFPVASWARDLGSGDYPDENFACFKDSGGGKAVALVRGNHLFCLDNRGKPQLFTYSLGFPPAGPGVTPVSDPALSKQMERECRGYVVAGLHDLVNHDAGPAPDAVQR